MPLVSWPAGAPSPALPERHPSLLYALILQLLLVRELLGRRFRPALRAAMAAAPRGAGETVWVFPGMGVGEEQAKTLIMKAREHWFTT